MPSVLVVGASRGIGLELVRQYCKAGWEVHATTRTPTAPGELAALDPAPTLHELEVRNAAHVQSLSRYFSTRSLDVVVHNAGVHERGHNRDEVMAINAVAPFAVVTPLLPSLQRAVNPRLVLVSSQLGARRGSTRSLGVYGDSKGALNDRFRELEAHWQALGITAIVLHPGWVRTDMGGPGAPLSVEASARGIRELIANLGAEHHGGFWTWDGRRHPW